jgi:hypothetical protein
MIIAVIADAPISAVAGLMVAALALRAVGVVGTGACLPILSALPAPRPAFATALPLGARGRALRLVVRIVRLVRGVGRAVVGIKRVCKV